MTRTTGKLVRPPSRPPAGGSRGSVPRKPPPRQSPNLAIILGIALVVLVVVAVGIVVVLALTASAAPVIPTVAQLPSATIDTSADRPIIEATLPPTDAPLARATLPPTWTPPPTAVLIPTATITPTLLPGQSAPGEPPRTAFPTLSMAQLSNTYWDGDGSLSMWDAQFEDGTFGRFTYLPVNFWVGARGVSITQAHEEAIVNAINEISQVVPIQRVDNRIYAHMTLWLMSDTEFEQNVGCAGPHMTIGCASFNYTEVGILLVTIWLRANTENFATTLLHELTHGLGIPVHSPHEADVMYAYDLGQPPHYTQRDLNTLRALYNAPPFDPRNN